MDAATGSPASLKLTKLTPLTTRPSLTSRHGMTRTLNMADCRPSGTQQGERLRRIEPAIVERATGNGARKFFGARRQQRPYVIDRGETARGDDRDRHRVGERDGGVEVQALEHAVARHIRIDDRSDAGVLKTPRDVERGQLRRCGPAFDRDFAIARVETDGDAARISARSFFHQRRVAHRRGADDDAGYALAEPALDRCHVANAAAELQRNFD